MAKEKEYIIDEEDDNSFQVNEPEPFLLTFSSQEEADNYYMKKNLQKTDMERLQALCRMIRIGQMLSNAKIIRQ